MRLIRGEHGWWCITRSGVALIPADLVHGGKLTPNGISALTNSGLHDSPTVNHYSLTVLTSTDCNLGCPYCFQNTAAAAPGQFNPPRIARATLGAKVVDQIAAFTKNKMTELNVSRLSLVLFGGEPLLNPLGCLRVLRRCAELGQLTGMMITNGTLLHSRLAGQLFTAGLRSAQVTLDGPREWHDQVRTTRAGRGTFEKILDNVATAQQTTGIEFTFRVNSTSSTMDRINELIEQLASRVDAYRSRFEIAMVQDYNGSLHGLLNRDSTTAKNIVSAYAFAQALGFRIARPGPEHCDFCSIDRGRLGAVVNADGALFSCWDSAGRPGYEVGTVAQGYQEDLTAAWVRCGDSTHNEPGGQMRRFRNDIDAGILDLIRTRRNLQATR